MSVSVSKNISFPAILYKKLFPEMETILIETESGNSHFLTFNNVLNNALIAGLIDDFDSDNEDDRLVYIDRYTFEGYSDEETIEVKEVNAMDWIGDLSLEDCSRILKSHIDNDDCQEDDLPF